MAAPQRPEVGEKPQISPESVDRKAVREGICQRYAYTLARLAR